MPLDNIEVERQLNARRVEVDQLNLTVKQLQAQISVLQTASTTTTTTVPTAPFVSETDSTLVGGIILHKLRHKFNLLVTFVTTTLFSGTATFTVPPIFNGLTASRPLKLDAGNALTSGKIDLTAPATDITGTLSVANGGIGVVTIPAYGVVLGNGTGAVATANPGTSGRVLTDNGGAANPSFQALPTTVVNPATGVLQQGNGGTGYNSLSTSDLRNNIGVPTAGVYGGAATVVLAKITALGTDGSLTVNTDGQITAYTAPT